MRTAGKVNGSKSVVSLTERMDAFKEQQMIRIQYASNRMEQAVLIVKDLKLAGMINKAGADRITHELVLGMASIEENQNEALPMDAIVL